jgi:hypothetical protein
MAARRSDSSATTVVRLRSCDNGRTLRIRNATTVSELPCAFWHISKVAALVSLRAPLWVMAQLEPETPPACIAPLPMLCGELTPGTTRNVMLFS